MKAGGWVGQEACCLPPVHLNSRALTAEIWWGWRRTRCKVSRRPEHSVRKGALQCGEHRAPGQAEELQPHAPARMPGHLGAGSGSSGEDSRPTGPEHQEGTGFPVKMSKFTQRGRDPSLQSIRPAASPARRRLHPSKGRARGAAMGTLPRGLREGGRRHPANHT